MSTRPAIAAIPTRYAGCHFRSRLEARWAVFFDHMRIDWVYEPEGFTTARSARFEFGQSGVVMQ